MTAAVLGRVPDLPSLVSMLVCDKKPVHFLSMCFNVIKCVQKTRQVYDPKIKMVRDAQFFHLNVNDS